tara:strand:- start:41 stop:469 length:429 start_codon:yes stop_codon:yes gene_type:complete
MIFKRKEGKPAGVGNFCYIKEEVIDKMMESESERTYYGKVNKESFKMSDVKMVYVNKESIYSNLFFEVAVLFIQEGAYSSWRKVEHNCSKGKTFLVRKESLSILSQEKVNNFLKILPNRTGMHIKNCMENGYNVLDFSWESR